ncbi:MAG: EpsI family protein [Armatimonadetes bacterium]|nr:EpsI family protein [Armatimonadota bacterium]
MQHYTRRCLTAAGLLLVGAGAVNAIWLRRTPEVRYQPDFRRVPHLIGDLRAERVPVEKRIFDYLGADAMEELSYVGPEGQQVRVSFVYGRDWRAVHDPLQCYKQQGWSVAESQTLEVPAPPGCPHPGPLKAVRMRVHKAGVTMLALYLFAYRGGTESDWTAQGWEVSRTPRGTGGLLVSMSAPVRNGDVQGADELLKRILQNVYVPLISFWYS